jgi:hypothetical protein
MLAYYLDNFRFKTGCKFTAFLLVKFKGLKLAVYGLFVGEKLMRANFRNVNSHRA